MDIVWEMWRDRTSIPNWMPWVASVELIPEDASLSRWVLRTEQFGREWTFSWIAKDLTPTKFQKVWWYLLNTAGVQRGGYVDCASVFCPHLLTDPLALTGRVC